MAEDSKMADSTKDAPSEVRTNYEAFLKKLPELLASHRGKIALMRAGELVEIFDTVGDAYKAGMKSYGEGLFSIQEITDSAVDLGFFNHAVTER